MDVRRVTHGSPEWHAEVELRREVLRRPLGLDFTEEDLRTEVAQNHVVALEGGEVVGCLVLAGLDDAVVKMRQVAVRPDRQRGGVGAALVRFAERYAVELGFRTMVLHARDTAVPFYLRLGYAVVEAPFVEVGIPHRKMVKAL